MKNWTKTKLPDGTTVLAKLYKGRPDPVRYVNYAQAETRVISLLLAGVAAHIIRPTTGRAIYIGIAD